uniref:DUF2528 family protein n=1 Tax=Meloidogyne hapla TaxID=6305 RepID=A0A1I8BU46_MELHA
MPLTITAEASTDVLIMRKGFGAYVISYQIELAPHKESSSCKEIRESIFDPEYHKYAPGIGHWDNGKWVEAKPMHGPLEWGSTQMIETQTIDTQTIEALVIELP